MDGERQIWLRLKRRGQTEIGREREGDRKRDTGRQIVTERETERKGVKQKERQLRPKRGRQTDRQRNF